MTGEEFSKWMDETGRTPQSTALEFEKSVATIYTMQRSHHIDRITVLALAYLGCETARREADRVLTLSSSEGASDA